MKWALSSALWNYFPAMPFTDILDVMKDTGFIGVRVTSFPQILDRYKITQAQMQAEVTKRGLHVVTISWNGPLDDPAKRQQARWIARATAMKFLADFGASHLVVFSPNRDRPGSEYAGSVSRLCASAATGSANWPGPWALLPGCTTTWGRWCRTRKRWIGLWR